MSAYNKVPDTTNENKKGFKFPFQRGKAGFPALSEPEKIPFSHIASLLFTGKNERVMDPTEGVDVHSYVFDNLTPITMARISSAVTRAIHQWIPEVRVLRVSPEMKIDDNGTNSIVMLHIQYRVANQSMSAQVPVTVGSVQQSGV